MQVQSLYSILSVPTPKAILHYSPLCTLLYKKPQTHCASTFCTKARGEKKRNGRRRRRGEHITKKRMGEGLLVIVVWVNIVNVLRCMTNNGRAEAKIILFSLTLGRWCEWERRMIADKLEQIILAVTNSFLHEQQILLQGQMSVRSTFIGLIRHVSTFCRAA